MKIEYKFPSHRQMFSEKKRENREILPRFLKMPTKMINGESCVHLDDGDVKESLREEEREETRRDG